jgi:hypothetical protein
MIVTGTQCRIPECSQLHTLLEACCQQHQVTALNACKSIRSLQLLTAAAAALTVFAASRVLPLRGVPVTARSHQASCRGDICSTSCCNSTGTSTAAVRTRQPSDACAAAVNESNSWCKFKPASACRHTCCYEARLQPNPSLHQTQ